MQRFQPPAVEQVLDLVAGESCGQELDVGDDAMLRRPEAADGRFISHLLQYSDAL